MAQGQKIFLGSLGVILIVGGVFIYKKMGGTGPISYSANPTITPADTSGFRGYLLGSDTAPLEVTEYADLQCPGCQQFATVQFPDVKKRLIDTGKIRFRYRDFPWDELHSNPRPAAHSAACANAQGKFWEVEAGIYERQTEWSPMPNPMPVFKEIVTKAGLDVNKWTACMEAKTYAGRIQASRLEGDAIGIRETPSFVIGGKIFTGLTSDDMVKVVDSITAAMKPVSGTTTKP